MAQKSFLVDDKTQGTLEKLRKELNLQSDAAVIRRSLALMNLMVDKADKSTHTVTVKDKDEKETQILLSD